MLFQVKLTEKAQKDLLKIPFHVAKKLQIWAEQVETKGLFETRKISGYHDEPLRGSRHGQRSVRLNQAYRAFYNISESGDIHIISILEVNKHDY